MQSTLAHQIQLSGISLHSGKYSILWIYPAAEDSGIRMCNIPQDTADFFPLGLGTKKFKVLDSLSESMVSLPESMISALNQKSTPVTYKLVSQDFSLCTRIEDSRNSFSIQTIEHLMAGLWLCGIDNALLVCSESEVPILDGSAKDFVAAIQAVGTCQQSRVRRVVQIDEIIRVEEDGTQEGNALSGGKYIELSPLKEEQEYGEIYYCIDFPNIAAIGRQEIILPFDRASLISQIAEARTFGSIADLDNLRKMNLALGATLDNAVAFDGSVVLNEDGLRFSDEAVRHKVLDLIGDFALAGCDLKCNVKVYKGGHKLHNSILRKALRD